MRSPRCSRLPSALGAREPRPHGSRRTARCSRARRPRSRVVVRRRRARRRRESRRFATAAARSSPGTPRVVGARTLVVPLRRGLADGDYSVRWSIVSDDGHLESGVLAFAVGARPARRRSPGSRRRGDRARRADSVGARWLFFAGVLGAAGIALFTFVVRPRDAGAHPAHRLDGRRARGARRGAGDPPRRSLDSRRQGARRRVRHRARRRDAAALRRRSIARALAAGASCRAAARRRAGVRRPRARPGLPRVNVVADVLHVLSAAAAGSACSSGSSSCRGADLRRAGVLALGGRRCCSASPASRARSYELTALSQLWEHVVRPRAARQDGAAARRARRSAGCVRQRPRERAGVELVLVAALVVAVSVLVELAAGTQRRLRPRAVAQASQPSPPPPPPPAGAVVLAREAGPLGVAIAVEPKRVTAIVLSPAGGGLSGLDVRDRRQRCASRCGSGCYTGRRDARGAVVACRSTGFGPTQTVSFVRARARRRRRTRSCAARARAYRALRSVTYRERARVRRDARARRALAAREAEPPRVLDRRRRAGHRDRHDGAGTARRRTGRWVESAQTPLPQPATQWTYATNAHVLAQTPTTTTVSFVDPTIPAYFTVVARPRDAACRASCT